MSFFVAFKYFGLLVIWWQIGRWFVTQSAMFFFSPPRICGNDFVVFWLWPNKISFQLLWIFSFFSLHWQCCLPLYFPLPPVLVIVGEPFLLGEFSWMSLSSSFQIILPILLPWLIPWHFSLWYNLHLLVHFTGEFLVLVCWILVLGKNINLLWFVPLVLICGTYLNICA